jgi:hypothetical protein
MVPSGMVPSGMVPSGMVPSGMVPSGTVVSSIVPNGIMLSGNMPSVILISAIVLYVMASLGYRVQLHLFTDETKRHSHEWHYDERRGTINTPGPML